MRITVVTPSFNQAQFLPANLRSVSGQSHPDVEHILVDPGSSDGSRELARDYVQLAQNGVLIAEPDRGQSDGITKGFAAATGDVITWLNSDDFYPDADVLADVAKVFEQNPDIDIVYGRVDFVDEAGEFLRKGFVNAKTETLLDSFMYQVGIVQPGVFTRRSVFEKIGGPSEQYEYCMDYEYWVRMATSGLKWKYLDRKLAHHRWWGGMKTSKGRDQSLVEHMRVCANYFGFVHWKWLDRYAEYLASGQDGVVNHAATVDAEAKAHHLRQTIRRFVTQDMLRLLEKREHPEHAATLDFIRAADPEFGRYYRDGSEVEIVSETHDDPDAQKRIAWRIMSATDAGGQRYRAYHVPKNFDRYFLEDWSLRQRERGIAALRRLAAGRRDVCVVVGNGPSLKQTDLSQLEYADVIASNFAMLNRDISRFARIFTVTNDLVAKQGAVDFNNIRTTKIAPFWLSNSLNATGETYFLDATVEPKFCTDPEGILSWRSTVSFFNLQLAYLLGYKRVLLVGFDNSYNQPAGAKEGDVIEQKADDDNHFDPRYFKGKIWQAADTGNMETAYLIAKEAYEADGREIINCTVGGKLEVFPRMDLKAAIEATPGAPESAPTASRPSNGSAPPELPRVLLLDHTRIGDGTATGDLKAMLFRGWPADRLLQVFNQGGGRLGVLENGSAGSVEGADQSERRSLADRIRQFQPQVVLYRPVPQTLLLHDFAMEIIEACGAPVVPWIMDDWLSALSVSDPAQLARLDRDWRRLVSAAPVRLSISDAMSAEFSKRYGGSFSAVANGVDAADWPVARTHSAGQPVRIRYAGSVSPNMGRETLRLIAEATERLAGAGVPVTFEIQTQPHWLDVAGSEFSAFRSTTLNASPMPMDAYRAWLASADIVLIAYNFDDVSRQYIRYSVANKLPECLASGAALLAVGPADVATLQILESLDCGVRITQPDLGRVVETLEDLCSNAGLRQSLADRARRVAFRSFDAEGIRRRFQDFVTTAARKPAPSQKPVASGVPPGGSVQGAPAGVPAGIAIPIAATHAQPAPPVIPGSIPGGATSAGRAPLTVFPIQTPIQAPAQVPVQAKSGSEAPPRASTPFPADSVARSTVRPLTIFPISPGPAGGRPDARTVPIPQPERAPVFKPDIGQAEVRSGQTGAAGSPEGQAGQASHSGTGAGLTYARAALRFGRRALGHVRRRRAAQAAVAVALAMMIGGGVALSFVPLSMAPGLLALVAAAGLAVCGAYLAYRSYGVAERLSAQNRILAERIAGMSQRLDRANDRAEELSRHGVEQMRTEIGGLQAEVAATRGVTETLAAEARSLAAVSRVEMLEKSLPQALAQITAIDSRIADVSRRSMEEAARVRAATMAELKALEGTVIRLEGKTESMLAAAVAESRAAAEAAQTRHAELAAVLREQSQKGLTSETTLAELLKTQQDAATTTAERFAQIASEQSAARELYLLLEVRAAEQEQRAHQAAAELAGLLKTQQAAATMTAERFAQIASEQSAARELYLLLEARAAEQEQRAHQAAAELAELRKAQQAALAKAAAASGRLEARLDRSDLSAASLREDIERLALREAGNDEAARTVRAVLEKRMQIASAALDALSADAAASRAKIEALTARSGELAGQLSASQQALAAARAETDVNRTDLSRLRAEVLAEAAAGRAGIAKVENEVRAARMLADSLDTRSVALDNLLEEVAAAQAAQGDALAGHRMTQADDVRRLEGLLGRIVREAEQDQVALANLAGRVSDIAARTDDLAERGRVEGVEAALERLAVDQVDTVQRVSHLHGLLEENARGDAVRFVELASDIAAIFASVGELAETSRLATASVESELASLGAQQADTAQHVSHLHGTVERTAAATGERLAAAQADIAELQQGLAQSYQTLAAAEARQTQLGQSVEKLVTGQSETRATVAALRVDLQAETRAVREDLSIQAGRGDEIVARQEAADVTVARLAEEHLHAGRHLSRLHALLEQEAARMDALRLAIEQAARKGEVADEALSRALGDASGRIEALAAGLETIGQAQTASAAQIAALAEAQDGSTGAVAAVRADLGKTRSDLTDVSQHLTRLHKVVDDRTVRLEALRERIDAALAAAAEAKSDAGRMEAGFNEKVAGLAVSVRAVESRLSEADRELGDLAKAGEDVGYRVSETEAAVERLAAEQADAAQRASALHGLIEGGARERKALAGRVDKLAADSGETAGRIAAAEGRLEQTDKAGSLRFEQQGKELARLAEQATDTARHVSRVHGFTEEIRERIDKLQAGDIAAIRKSVASGAKDTAMIRERVGVSERQIGALKYPDAPGTLVFFGAHKCASRFFRMEVFGRVAESLGARTRSYQVRMPPFHYSRLDELDLANIDFKGLGEGGRDVVLFANASLRSLDKIQRSTKDWKGLRIIRDPRQVLVSDYFHHKGNHDTAANGWIWDQLVRDKPILNELTEEEGLLHELDNISKDVIESLIVPKFDDERVLTIRVEDFSETPQEHLRKIAEFLEVPEVAGIDFGNTRANPDSGPWQQHFTSRLREVFKERYGQALIDLGYAEDMNW